MDRRIITSGSKRLSSRAPRRRRRRWGGKRRRGVSQRLPYASRGTLLSRGEAAFYAPLQEAVGSRYLIMCKVRVADVLMCSETDWHRGHGGAISQKHLDFVLCEGVSTRIVLAIELDDRSHAADHRRRRDAFLNEALRAAGVPLLRIRARARYSAEIIGRLVARAVRESSIGSPRCNSMSHRPATAS